MKNHKPVKTKARKINKNASFFNMGSYSTTKRAKILIGLMLFLLVLFFGGWNFLSNSALSEKEVLGVEIEDNYWLLLHRKSNLEFLMKGVPGDESKSSAVKTFKVKTGVPGEKPTPLPQLVGKDYWVITKKFDSSDNYETAPYFIELNVPASDYEPYGPAPYLECNGQCNWELPGPFGLHGVNGDFSRLTSENPGSSGCIRHEDEDITFLYNILDPSKKEIRYYIKDI